MLQFASFRGVPFAVISSDVGGGRRLALHQYPGRDIPWSEDMGRSARKFRLRGFILDGDIITSAGAIAAQRSNLITALEKAGEGTLIHPTFGSLTVKVDTFTVGEGLGAQSYSDVEVAFAESGTQTFPSGSKSTASQASTAATGLNNATSIAAVASLAGALSAGGTIAQAIDAATSWASVIEGAVTDATAMYRLAAELTGSFGRYSAGGNAGVSGSNSSPYAAGTSVADIVPIASANRHAALGAAAAFQTTVEAADISNAPEIAVSAQDMVAALVAACADPADAIRLLLSLIDHEVTGLTSIMATAVNDLMLRTLAAALTAAVTDYQPKSADDAAARMGQIGDDLYDLMTVAGDAGEDDVFAALRDCRGSVVAVLREKGGTLARLRTFSFAMPLPSLVLAQSIYSDAARADELVTQADPVHPLFMPTSFQALAS